MPQTLETVATYFNKLEKNSNRMITMYIYNYTYIIMYVHIAHNISLIYIS